MRLSRSCIVQEVLEYIQYECTTHLILLQLEPMFSESVLQVDCKWLYQLDTHKHTITVQYVLYSSFQLGVKYRVRVTNTHATLRSGWSECAEWCIRCTWKQADIYYKYCTVPVVCMTRYHMSFSSCDFGEGRHRPTT